LPQLEHAWAFPGMAKEVVRSMVRMMTCAMVLSDIMPPLVYEYLKGSSLLS
jgi:hypothetical protein